MKPENYSLGLIPIFSLFLSASNRRMPASVNEEFAKNSNRKTGVYNENECCDWKQRENINTEFLKAETIGNSKQVFGF